MTFDTAEALHAFMTTDEGYRSPVVLRAADETIWTAFEDEASSDLYIQTIRSQPVGSETAIEVGAAIAEVEGYYLTAAAEMPGNSWPMVAIALPR
jgi:hypothetical protein